MRRVAATYAVAVGALAVAVLLRSLLDPLFGDALPFVTLFGAVAFAVWIGGPGPATLVAVLGYAAASYLFISPRGQVLPVGLPSVIGLVAYLFTCALVIVFGEVARRATRRATERREVLRVTLRSIGDAVITTDIDGRITYLNAVAESLTGWTHDDAIGQRLDSVFRIVNEDSRQPVENPATRALREGNVVGLANHTILLRKDGSECPIDDSAAPIRDEAGNVSGCVLIFRDVTAQRRMEQERANQLHTARLLASIVESSDDAIFSKSLNGTIQSWNAGAERLFGHPAGDAVGKHISLIIPADRLQEEYEIIARLKAGERIEHFETERIRRDGRRIFVSLTISPIRDASGTVVGASKIVRDVTERKRAEDALRALAADLADADRKKNEFLAMLAHELRNPLAPISNAARTLRLGMSDQQTVRSASEMIERQVGQLARLVDDLLDVSRITRGKIELRKTIVALAPIVQQAVEAVRPLARSQNHELTVTLPPHEIYVDADPARLAQIVGNVLNNACKFTDEGGHIELTVSEDDQLAVIRVRDDGIGIAPENQPAVFDMFAQVDASLERSRDGLGLGLTLVKTLVELHGGTVTLNSDGPGRGSEFTLRLPIALEVPQELARSELRPTQMALPRRVLIVDDNDDGAESLSMLLQFEGHDTLKVHDGPAAIAAAERFRPDVMLLDIGLPGMSGYEVCRRVRQESWASTMTIVALTGWGQEEDRQRSQEAGFDMHMVKPVDHDALIRLLASIPVPTKSG